MARFILSAFADEIAEDLKTQMDVLDEHGIKYIEMRGVNGKNITQHTLEEVKEIKRQLSERGFRISAVGSPIGKIKITDDFKQHMELFKHTLEIAKILQTPYVRMFSFFMPKGENPAVYRDEVMGRLKKLVHVAEEAGIILLHENEKEIFGDIPERCLDIFNTINSPALKATFDPANFVQCNVSTYPQAFSLLKDQAVYMHIKDALFSDHSVVPAGMGDGKVKEIIKELYISGYEGFLSLEPHLGAFKGFADLEPDAASKHLPDSGPGLFGIAVKALKNILEELEEKEK